MTEGMARGEGATAIETDLGTGTGTGIEIGSGLGRGTTAMMAGSRGEAGSIPFARIETAGIEGEEK